MIIYSRSVYYPKAKEAVFILGMMPITGYPNGLVGNEDAYSYMSSPLFIGYKGMRAGVSSNNPFILW